MGLVLTQSSTALGAVAASIEDSFARTSASIASTQPDVTNTPGNSWTVSVGAIRCETDDGGVAVSNLASGVNQIEYDMGTTAYMDCSATFICGNNVGGISTYVAMRWLDTNNNWSTYWSRSAGTANIGYKKTGTFVTKATTPHGGGNGVTQDVTCSLDGTTCSATWIRSGETSNVSYTLTTEDVFSTAQHVGIFIGDTNTVIYPAATHCTTFSATEL